jgi:hypothetical protein
VPACLYRCPATGDNVQGWSADGPEDDNLTYVQVTCLACAQAHLVNPKTRKVRGSDDDAFTQRALRSYGAVGLSVSSLKIGGRVEILGFTAKGGPISLVANGVRAGRLGHSGLRNG